MPGMEDTLTVPAGLAVEPTIAGTRIGVAEALRVIQAGEWPLPLIDVPSKPGVVGGLVDEEGDSSEMVGIEVARTERDRISRPGIGARMTRIAVGSGFATEVGRPEPQIVADQLELRDNRVRDGGSVRCQVPPEGARRRDRSVRSLQVGQRPGHPLDRLSKLGVQSRTPAAGKRKSAGITPTTVRSRPSSRIVRPTTPGSPPKRSRQSPSLSSTTPSRTGASSPGRSVRPTRAGTPSAT